MDKIHKLIAFFTIMRVFDLTIADTTHADDKANGRDFTTYQLSVPGKQPITILEADNVQIGQDKDGISPYSDYSSVGFTKRVSHGPTYHSESEMYSMKPFPFSVLPEDDGKNNAPKKNFYNPSLLEKFLQNYQGAATEDDNEAVDMEGAINVEALDNLERKNYRPQKNSGWVSLDPVPTYSAGKVYRWQSNAQKYRPVRPSYSQNHWNDEDDDDRYHQQRPQRPSYSYDDRYPESFDDDEGYQVPPKPFGSTYPGSNSHRPHDKPYSNRPSGYQGNKPFYGDNDEPDRYHSHKKRPYNDIITDNRPSNFPQYDTHRYGSSGGYTDKKGGQPETYPGHGEGQWVLVSTTKGHQYNNRKSGMRSMSHRGGKNGGNNQGESNGSSSISTVLHVLPNPNSRNITTSNGEVIEVAESGN